MQNIQEFINQCQQELNHEFQLVDEIAYKNFKKIHQAFQENRVALRHFAGTTGYGYDDVGRDTLCKIFADVFGCEKAIFSPNIVSGTHAISLCLFGVLRPNDVLLSISGEIYDTLENVVKGSNIGSLKDFGIDYDQIELKDGDFDHQAIAERLAKQQIKMVYIQRSRGYCLRQPLSIEQIEKVCKTIKQVSPQTIIFVDNCYGEFIDTQEPVAVGADLMAGSMIKNPGGGLAPTGGYVAGKEVYVDLTANRLTAPSIGMEVGSYMSGYQYFYQGFYQSSHTVAQAIKGGMLFAHALTKLGFNTLPKSKEHFKDIICSIEFDTAEQLIKFCQTIQYASPIDSFVTPMPWDMPGYNEQVIMAAGCFVQGASIELSCDSPIKAPYVAYLQGGLSFEHTKLALEFCIEKLNLLR
ncbi:MAG: methionine gamma-lyase family protein [Clostridia bacterium]|nr:methionine gamma-lyase family protein [Clostridia bacterium]